MELRRLRAGYAIVYVILLCTLAMGSIEGKRRADMLFGNCDPELKEKMVCWPFFCFFFVSEKCLFFFPFLSRQGLMMVDGKLYGFKIQTLP